MTEPIAAWSMAREYAWCADGPVFPLVLVNLELLVRQGVIQGVNQD